MGHLRHPRFSSSPLCDPGEPEVTQSKHLQPGLVSKPLRKYLFWKLVSAQVCCACKVHEVGLCGMSEVYMRGPCYSAVMGARLGCGGRGPSACHPAAVPAVIATCICSSPRQGRGKVIGDLPLGAGDETPLPRVGLDFCPNLFPA